MTRWFLGFASLPLTLLASGCLPMRALRIDSASAPSPAAREASPYGTMKPPEALPTVLPAALAEPAATPPPNPQKADASTTNPNWSPLITPPPPIPPRFPTLPKELVEPVSNSVSLIDATPKYPLVRALDCTLDNRHDEALKHLQSYDANTQKLLLRMLPMFSFVAKKSHLNSADVAALNVQMTGIMDALQEKTEFRISKLCFCESIKEFAIYKELPPDHEFLAALPPRVGERITLYVGFKNFASQANQGKFESVLGCRVDIVDDQGKIIEPVFQHEKRPVCTQRPMNEFYANLEFSLPALPPGWYELRVEMSDETVPGARRSDSRRLPFRVAAP